MRKQQLLAMTAVMFTALAWAQPTEKAMQTLYGISVTTITGEEQDLSAYAGHVLLIVNTASKCGFTGQYDGLQKLYETYKDKGFLVLGFPSNDFGRQEPGNNEQIEQFCTLNFGVTFPMFAKIDVKGETQHPLYAFLTSKETNPEHSGQISWNFNKFLIAKDGRVVARFGSRVKPADEKLVKAIEAQLAAD